VTVASNNGVEVQLSEALRRRRMTRNFSGRPLSRDLVDSMLADALRAPSAGNTQSREFVILEGPAETAQYWQATTDEAWRSTSRRIEGLSRAPVVVLPFADPEAYLSRYREPDKARSDGVEVEWVVPFWFVDAAYAVMTLLLRATDEGIGAAFLGNFRGEPALRAALGVPDRYRWLGAVLLGEAAQPDPPSSSLSRRSRPIDDVVHRGHW
jgi:nitroreductase